MLTQDCALLVLGYSRSAPSGRGTVLHSQAFSSLWVGRRTMKTPLESSPDTKQLAHGLGLTKTKPAPLFWRGDGKL